MAILSVGPAQEEGAKALARRLKRSNVRVVVNSERTHISEKLKYGGSVSL